MAQFHFYWHKFVQIAYMHKNWVYNGFNIKHRESLYIQIKLLKFLKKKFLKNNFLQYINLTLLVDWIMSEEKSHSRGKWENIYKRYLVMTFSNLY